MVDTLSLEYEFQNTEMYNAYYKAIDEISDKKGMRIHKKKKGHKTPCYVTTVFQPFGFLEIQFFKYAYVKVIRILLKPARLLQANSHLRLSTYSEYVEIEKRFNSFIDLINRKAEQKQLPYLADWNVIRIDYAIDLYTPHVYLYVRLFHAGFTTRGFKDPKPYQTSFYMPSNRMTYNFYDKIAQVKSKHGYTDEDIQKELGQIPDGILRMEIQCKSKALSYLRHKYGVNGSSVRSFWNPMIAAELLKKRIAAIIGKENFFQYSDCVFYLSEYYSKRTYHICKSIPDYMMSEPHTSLRAVKDLIPTKQKRKYFNSIIHKIRRVGINPIPMDMFPGVICPKFLENPYRLIDSYMGE